MAGPGRSRRWAARRVTRDAYLRLRHPNDHVAYYRAVMQDTVSQGAARAVGNRERSAWVRGGVRQFEYLRSHGLQPQDRLLEIGCGNLRAGWRFIDYLHPGNYVGIDISPGVLAAAAETLTRQGVADKRAELRLVDDLSFDFAADHDFDIVHAHSVFSHSPLDVIEQAFTHVGRILRPGGFFDFTFNRTDGREHNVLREDFYYRSETLLALAEKCGLSAQFMADWEALAPKQSKIRVRPI